MWVALAGAYFVIRICFTPGRWSASKVRRAAGASMALVCRQLGGAVLKAGQILGSRPDLLDDDMRQPLARLHRHAGACPLDRVWTGERRARMRIHVHAVEASPIGSGCVAQVHRAWRTDGSVVVLKCRRPRVAIDFARDFAIGEWLMSAVSMLPYLANVPVTMSFEIVKHAVLAQLDFEREAKSARTCARHFEGLDAITIPRVLDCTHEVIAMEYIPGLVPIGGLSDPGLRRQAAVAAVRAVYQMIFIDGCVHCDLHPGNVFYSSEGKLVLLDFGLAVQLSDDVRMSFVELFLGFIFKDAKACAKVAIDNAMHVPAAFDRAAFTRAMATLLARHNLENVQSFQIARFAFDMFDVQRRFRVLSTPQFVWPIASLLSLEGMLKECAPDLDFKAEATPFVLDALAAAHQQRLAASQSGF